MKAELKAATGNDSKQLKDSKAEITRQKAEIATQKAEIASLVQESEKD